MKELSIPHRELDNPQTITQRTQRAFAEADLDIHRHEVVELVDEFSTQRRIYKIRNVKIFDMGRRG
jgi:hypothetical protein